MNIQKRLLRHFAQGKPLSIKNMWMLKITNPAREVARAFETPFKVSLKREKIKWNENNESGYYFQYTVNNDDLPYLRELCKIQNISL